MKEPRDVATGMFANDYRNVKLRGKKARKNAPGTGSCFDTTEPLEVHQEALKASLKVPPTKLDKPIWDCALMCYRLPSPTRMPKDFLKAGSAPPYSGSKHEKKVYESKPPVAGAYLPRANLPDTAFRRQYEMGNLPVAVEHCGYKNVIRWKAEVAKLDYSHYLPLFFDGIRETQEPFRFLALKGTEDLLQLGGDQILPVIPLCIQPLKRALQTRDKQVMILALRLLQKLVVSAELVGRALVPYYRQLLPICNMYAQDNKNIGDRIDYAQHEGNCMGEVVAETLQLLEMHGGPDAFINIKYLVPTYEHQMGS